jgi:hypothetical protein
MKNLILSLANLTDELVQSGCLKAASKISDILRDILEFQEKSEEEDQESNDVDIAANIIGLREDGTTTNMNQGYALPPAFSPYGQADLP